MESEFEKLSIESLDPFAKRLFDLPESLVVLIFNKVKDAKTLFHFYSVSERCANLVSETRSVSVQVPYDMALIPGEEAEWPEGLLNFLAKFSCIESMSICFTPGVDIDNVNHLMRWRGDKNGLVYLKAQDLNYEGGVEAEEVLPPNNRPRLWDSPARIKYIEALQKKFPSLKRISSVDYADEGVIDLEEGCLKDMKNMNLMMAQLPYEGELEIAVTVRVKIWRIPTIDLPLSGTKMKNVLFYFETNEDGSEELMIKNAFPEAELSELVHIIMQRQPSYEALKSLAKFFLL